MQFSEAKTPRVFLNPRGLSTRRPGSYTGNFYCEPPCRCVRDSNFLTILEKKKIFLFADWYEPGYKAGGPIRSCVNFVQHMKRDYAIHVFTSDRDLGSETAYENVRTDTWNESADDVRVYYCSPGRLTWKNIKQQLLDTQPDFIYLNSMFSKYFTIYPLFISRQKKVNAKIILAPRGMLRASAIQFKIVKKKFYLKAFRWFGFAHHVHFHAADETEVKDVQRYFGPSSLITMIPNFAGSLPDLPVIAEKKIGELSMIFVGRIHPIKNLDYLLSVLQTTQANTGLTIVGSLEDKAYWEKCTELIHGLPGNISVNYLGEQPNHQLPAIIAQHHIFVLPTKGENFGHAIFEALGLGKPVLISDQTPWRGLEKAGAGWDISLDQPGLFNQAIEQAAALGQDQYSELVRETFNFAGKHVEESNISQKYKTLFS